MSIRLMTLMWDVRFPTQSQLLVALKIADYANDQGGSIFPSRNRLADLTQTSESTVKNVLRAFRSVGLLHVTKEGGHGPKSTTHYEVNLRLLGALSSGACAFMGTADELVIHWIEKGSEFDPLEGSTVDPIEAVRGQSNQLRGQPGAAKGSIALTPIHQTNHQIDSSGAGARASDASASRAPREVLPAAIVQIKRGDPSWTNWLDAVDVEVAERMEQAGAFDASSRWPKGKSDRVVIAGNNFTNRMLGERVE